MNVFGKEMTGRDVLANFLALFWPPMLVFLLHVCLFRIWNAYFFLPWIDIPMHFLGGLSMAYSLSAILFFLQPIQTFEFFLVRGVIGERGCRRSRPRAVQKGI